MSDITIHGAGRMKVVFLAPLAVARALIGLAALLLAWLVIRLALLGEHPTKPLPKWKEVISRNAVKVVGRFLLFIGSGGSASVKVCYQCGCQIQSATM